MYFTIYAPHKKMLEKIDFFSYFSPSYQINGINPGASLPKADELRTPKRIRIRFTSAASRGVFTLCYRHSLESENKNFHFTHSLGNKKDPIE